MRRASGFHDLLGERYARLFREHPFDEGPELARHLAALIADESTRRLFRLDEPPN